MACTLRAAALWGGTSFLAATAALAQDLEDPDGVYLGEIQLYGDRAASTLDQSEASVAVLTEDQLASPTVRDVNDAFKLIANVSDGDLTENGFVIRGINSEGLTPGGAGAPLASFYIDGVQQTAEAARRGARGVFDAEQIEVYRGPQSTLTGRNALAGAIYLRTRDPDFLTSGQVQLTYGENNHVQTGIAYGAPLSDNLAMRFSAEYSRKDSDINYPSYAAYPWHDDLAQDEYYTLRGKLLWLPTGSDDTRVLFSLSHSYDSPTPNQIAGPNWSAAGVSYDDMRGDIYGDISPYGFALPLFQDVRDTTVDNAGIEITHAFSDRLVLTALTGLSSSITDRRSVNYGYPVADPDTDFEGAYNVGSFDQMILSQEVRLNYDSERLRWVAGVYAADESNDGWREQFLLGSTTRTDNTADIRNYALFGQVDYEFSPNWSVIAGGRIDYYKQSQTATAVTTDVNGVVTTTSASASSHDETAFIPKLGLAYRINPFNTVALTYQEGYRPGGSGVRLSDAQPFSYDAEKAKNIELSWKGSLMGGRLNVGANVFYQDWDNQQVEIWAIPGDSTSSYIANAGQSESYGGEVEINYFATDRLNIYASLGLLHTEFKDFSIGSLNLAGQPFSNAPEQSFVLGLFWGASTGWFAGGNMTYTGSALSRIEGATPRAELAHYVTVDAQVGYAWDTVSITAYATNLFDETFYTYEYGPGSVASLGDRREVGIRLNKTF
ncbi:TonB-dependent receptor [Marinibacterium sp. SX1]|uniref:TonB-dependent receptor n=1 Tax=Marinibacterium sp. SX1 TaxID=3388424 RepID=UPI003D16F076